MRSPGGNGLVLDGIERALTMYLGTAALDVAIVSYRAPRQYLQEVIARFGG